ncbi:TRM11 family SAM-dependent methyltransferase [Paenibacillus terricola]|uniref:TRM11 family SAM-dependent methyltransferase n=1 Tax=Paenibacillus terricola TaxID=2763503 RepID=UPI002964F591|nr:RNA methyltransferase [Paenibacillus terricola]
MYVYAHHEDEAELCGMELRALLGIPKMEWAKFEGFRYVVSTRKVPPSRSPFIKMRIEVEAASETLDGLAEQAPGLDAGGGTFKVLYADTGDSPFNPDFEEKRAIERRIGAVIRGTASMRQPDRLFGVAYLGGRWVLGMAEAGEAVWLRHNEKPQKYSTALSTRVARAVANIAVPDPTGIFAVDPCCGIGTVVLEAQSMGIQMQGFDRNPLALRGARINLAHFGYPTTLAVKADMLTLAGRYDAAVLDLPYNLCSKLPEEEELAMLSSLGRLAPRAVVVATSPLEHKLAQTGWQVTDDCQVRKSSFVRYLYLVAHDKTE